VPNDPCERCHQRPNSWFTDGGYICHACMDEWLVFSRFFVLNFAPLPRVPVAR
jgi:hypothetical protein